MPLPIQVGSITDRLRKFFRIVGRTRFALDETVVPVVLVQDLTVGPYQAGVTPAIGSIEFPIEAPPTLSQVALMMNPGDAALVDTETDEFRGRSWTSEVLEISNRTANALIFRVHVIDRNTAIPPIVVPVTINSLLQSQQNRFGVLTVPVVLATYPGGLIVTPGDNLIWERLITAGGGANDSFRVPSITLGPTEALVFSVRGGPVIASLGLFNASGFYQLQPR